MYVNISIFIFEAILGVISWQIVSIGHVQGAYRNVICPITKLCYHNPWIFIIPFVYGIVINVYIRMARDENNVAVLYLTRVTYSIIFILIMMMIAILPYLKLTELIGVPANV